jgi:hypothetical protein
MKRLLILTLLFCAQFTFAKGHPSGIVGQVVLIACPVIGPEGCPPQPYQGKFFIYNAKGRLLEAITPDKEGFFVVDLKRGDYTLVPTPPEPPHIRPFGYAQDVEVEFKEFTPVTITFFVGP